MLRLPVLMLLLSGCATVRDTSAWISSKGEPATWAAHSTGAAIATAVGHRLDHPWFGCGLWMAAVSGWELSEWHERDKRGIRQARAWTTALDVATPLATCVVTRWIFGDTSPPEPVPEAIGYWPVQQIGEDRWKAYCWGPEIDCSSLLPPFAIPSVSAATAPPGGWLVYSLRRELMRSPASEASSLFPSMGGWFLLRPNGAIGSIEPEAAEPTDGAKHTDPHQGAG